MKEKKPKTQHLMEVMMAYFHEATHSCQPSTHNPKVNRLL